MRSMDGTERRTPTTVEWRTISTEDRRYYSRSTDGRRTHSEDRLPGHRRTHSEDRLPGLSTVYTNISS